jgi:hypothetical protein
MIELCGNFLVFVGTILLLLFMVVMVFKVFELLEK